MLPGCPKPPADTVLLQDARPASHSLSHIQKGLKGYPKLPLPGLQAGTGIEITLGLPGTWDQLIKKSIKNGKNWLTAAQPHVFGLGN